MDKRAAMALIVMGSVLLLPVLLNWAISQGVVNPLIVYAIGAPIFLAPRICGAVLVIWGIWTLTRRRPPSAHRET